MFNIVRKELDWNGKKLILETGKIARQADGAVVATLGDTTVLCTVVGAKKPKEGVDFFPLTVNYQEKFFAAGKIPGGFFKREGKATEKETLVSRLIDRPIRPLFDEKFRNDTQVVATVLSYDGVQDSDVVAIVGVAAALAISGIPFNGPIAGAKVGYKDGSYIMNPTIQELTESELELMVAGTETSVLMVESEAKELSEEIMLGAVTFGHKNFQPVIQLIKELAKEAGKPRWQVAYPETASLEAKVKSLAEEGFRAAYKEREKQARNEKIGAVEDKAEAAILAEAPDTDPVLLGGIIKELQANIVRNDILDNKIRIDGRNETQVRPILGEVGFLAKTHGSALFTRGETQALTVVTLGSGDDEQLIDALDGESKQHFMLHYNFPPYSVGEATPMRPPGRREIGHGKLAWRAIHPLLPSKEEFPYTVRIVSEITESNGSSSMATVCAASMALMDAGAPLARPIAGIAMGLIKEGEKFAVLSDIMGDEDHLGDMDFKVAGTEKGITALQMDIKINGITEEIMKIALAQANTGRIHILGEMNKAINTARGAVNENAPRLMTIHINKEKIREVIGSGGKVIRDICEKSACKVDISDDGKIVIAGANTEACEFAQKLIMDIAATAEIGKVYEGKVVRIVDFGAFVNFMGATDGLVHVSEIADFRVRTVDSVLKEGDIVKVKVLDVDPKGKVKLSMKAVDGNQVQQNESNVANDDDRGNRPEREPREGRHDRGDRGNRGDRGDRGDRGEREYRPRRDRDDRPRKTGGGGFRKNRDDNRDYNRNDNFNNNNDRIDSPFNTGAEAEAPKKKRKKFWE